MTWADWIVFWDSAPWWAQVVIILVIIGWMK